MKMNRLILLLTCLNAVSVSAFTVGSNPFRGTCTSALTTKNSGQYRTLHMSTTDNRVSQQRGVADDDTDTDDHDDDAHRNLKITTIESRDDLFDFLAEDERLCVVKFYASWCKSCAKFGIKYKQLARNHGDLFDDKGNEIRKGNVRFAEIEYGKNVQLCKSFGIKKLPFVQIYKATHGRIDEFSAGPKVFKEKVTTRVEELLEMSDDEISFEKNMKDGEMLGDSIVSSIHEGRKTEG